MSGTGYCDPAGRIVGRIGADEVRRPEWADKEAAFVALVDDFNVRGQREQVTHPGTLTWYRYCGCCGAFNGDRPTRSPAWENLTPSGRAL